MEPQPHRWRNAMNRARLAYATALSAMIGWSLLAPQPAQAQLLGSLIVTTTASADGSTVSGRVPVTASVTIIGALTVRGTVPVTPSVINIIGALTVRGVQFKLDGANLGAEDTSAPYSVSWNTTTASNGSHTLTAVATDILGVQWTSQPVTVTVSNASPPTITSFTPGSGPVGTSVTINGTNFTGASAVLFNGTSASFTVGSATAITATVPAGATSGPISVTTSDGTASSAASFTVINPPTISSFTPSSGPVGTSVTISGTNFNGATAVLFNSVSASFTVSSATAITATVPAGVSSGPISVTTSDGTASSAACFTVINPPTISSFTPGSGPVGASVTINGTNFTGASAVLFNGTSASFTVGSATAITATVPAGATSGPISVTTSDGTASSAASFTVINPPTISSFTPSSGPVGTSVTISGTNFNGATAVLFNSVSASFTVSSATAITATVPAGVSSGPISVTTSDGTASSAGSFTVINPPTITSFTPGSGPVGTSVTISGTNFTGASAVLFNGTSASFTVNSATSIAATVPSGATTGPISVTTSGGTASSASGFTVGDTTPPTVTIDQAAGQADPTSSSPTSIPAGVAGDAAGNLNTASTSTDNSVTFTLVSPVVLENQQPGSGNWQMWLHGIAPADDVGKQIKGYASATSVNLGESITFYVTVNPAQQYTMDVYRMGWYQGLGGRLMQSIGPLQGVAQPACPVDATTGLTECDWTASYTLTVPPTWTSGVFMVQLTNAQGYQNYITFVVRDDARVADIMFQQAVNTYQAYNNYPDDNATGKSLYDFNSYGANTVTGTPGAGQFFQWEFYFIRWLESSGYDVKYSTDLDTHENGVRLLNSKAFLSVGHNEYWSKPMYDGVQQARDAGIHLGFFGADAVFWQVRFEPSPLSGAADRVMVCYKNSPDGHSPDPVQGPTTTVLWRDPPVNRPEQQLVGVQFSGSIDVKTPNSPYVVQNSSSWVYAGTGLADGDSIPKIVGYEMDSSMSNFPLPASVAGTYQVLSQSPFVDSYSRTTMTANSSIYQAPSGAWVFGAGTTSWAWGLSDDGDGYMDPRIQRITANVLNRFGVSPPP